DELTPFERMLAEDVVGIVFVRLPQVPSARPFGTYPAASLLTYGTALLADPRPYEGAPEAAPRAFSERLKAACPQSTWRGVVSYPPVELSVSAAPDGSTPTLDAASTSRTRL